MFPLELFNNSLVENILAVATVVTRSGVIVISHKLVNEWHRAMPILVAPIHMVANVASLIPMFLIFAGGFVEMRMLMNCTSQTPMQIFRDAIMRGMALFCNMTLLSYIQVTSPPLFGAVVYCLGSALNVLFALGLWAIPGFLMTLFTIGVHIHFSYCNYEEKPYREDLVLPFFH
jgi:hypothetical protein